MQQKMYAYIVLFMCIPVMMYANGKETNIPETKKDVSVSGQIFVEWTKDIQNQDNAEQQNTFAVTRAYINVKKQFDSIFSARITTDVEQVQSQNTGGTVKSETNNYTLFLKYAYIQAQYTFGLLHMQLSGGMIGTPIIDYINDKSDYRWIEKNYVDNAKLILIKKDGKEQSLDSSADLGISGSVRFGILSLTGALLNGEGFKKVNEGQLGDDGKAYYGLATLRIVEGFEVFGSIRYEVTDDSDWNNNYRRYEAAGVTYSSSLLKCGAYYSLPHVKVKTESADSDDTFTLFDSWILINFNDVLTYPILVSGRYSRGKNRDMDNSEVVVWSLGGGYVFNDSFRMMLYFQHLKNAMYDDPESTLYVKTEVKL